MLLKRMLMTTLLLGFTAAATADDYAAQWGPAVGSVVPVLAANDQSGMAQDLSSLAGERGLLLFMNRSADW